MNVRSAHHSLERTLRWWRHCWTALKRWRGLASPIQ